MKAETTFGNTIKNLREKEKLTLREVAEHLDMTISMLGKIEKNSRRPTKQIIEKFAILFKVNVEDLTIDFLSDSVAYQAMYNVDLADKVLKVAERKVRYLKSKKKSQQ